MRREVGCVVQSFVLPGWFANKLHHRRCLSNSQGAEKRTGIWTINMTPTRTFKLLGFLFGGYFDTTFNLY